MSILITLNIYSSRNFYDFIYISYFIILYHVYLNLVYVVSNSEEGSNFQNM